MTNTPRDQLFVDVVVVGAGPSGLATAIRLKQKQPSLSILVLEKGAEVGAHIVSGAVVDPTPLDALLPGWRDEMGTPFRTRVREDRFTLVTPGKIDSMPGWLLPRMLKNSGSYIVSLGEVCRWLAGKARRRRLRLIRRLPVPLAASLSVLGQERPPPVTARL